MYCPPSTTSLNAASTSARTEANWLLTSTRGIFCTSSHSSGPEKIRRQQKNTCNDGVFDVPEVVVEALVARPEPIACTGDREGPDRGAQQRQKGVRHERHPEDAGRDRDERPHDRRDAPEQHTPVPP